MRANIKVEIYSTPSCPYCVKAKEFFKEKGIKFTEYNVARDQKMAQKMVERTGQMGVPVIDIDGEIVIGFDKSKIEELLGKVE